MKSIDIAIVLLDKAIERGLENPKYYMDYIKLHKLMYLGQCYLNYEYDFDLFDEDVIADGTGPYVCGLELITAKCGFSQIKNIDALKQYTLFSTLPLPLLREETCELILDKFGTYNTDEIVRIAKNTMAYRTIYGKDCNLINRKLMSETGKILFEEKKQTRQVDIFTERLAKESVEKEILGDAYLDFDENAFYELDYQSLLNSTDEISRICNREITFLKMRIQNVQRAIEHVGYVEYNRLVQEEIERIYKDNPNLKPIKIYCRRK